MLFNAKPPVNTDELVNWQTVLRTVQYFNTLSGPGVPQVFIDFDYTDGFRHVGTTRETTVTIGVPPQVDLNGAAGGTGFAATWTQAGMSALPMRLHAIRIRWPGSEPGVVDGHDRGRRKCQQRAVGEHHRHVDLADLQRRHRRVDSVRVRRPRRNTSKFCEP